MEKIPEIVKETWASASNAPGMLQWLRMRHPRHEPTRKQCALLFCACAQDVEEDLPTAAREVVKAMLACLAGIGPLTGVAAIDPLGWSKLRRWVDRLIQEEALGFASLAVLHMGQHVMCGDDLGSLILTALPDLIHHLIGDQSRAILTRRQADWVREFVRDPAAPPFDQALAWGTPWMLAATIYQDQAWQDLPVLADALEEAGCTTPDLLEHLRRPDGHRPGCWALDLLVYPKEPPT